MPSSWRHLCAIQKSSGFFSLLLFRNKESFLLLQERFFFGDFALYWVFALHHSWHPKMLHHNKKGHPLENAGQGSKMDCAAEQRRLWYLCTDVSLTGDDDYNELLSHEDECSTCSLINCNLWLQRKCIWCNFAVFYNWSTIFFFVGPQTAFKGHEEASVCSPKSKGNPAEVTVEDEVEQAESKLHSCGVKNLPNFVSVLCFLQLVFQELVSCRNT